MHSASNADAQVAQLLSSVAGYDVNLAASLVGFAAARVGENFRKLQDDPAFPGADISERVVTLAKITGWRIGTAISTIAMSSVEHGMVQADVNTLVQAQLPIVTSQATMEANAILQTMSSSTTSEKPQSETENNDNISGGKKATGSGNSGGSGGTGVDSMGNNVNAQATSAPEATILAMQQAQQAAVARWMNDLGGAPFMQQQQQQLQQLQQQQQQQQQQLLLLQQQQQQRR